MTAIYVATTGNDSTGDGSSGNPYATPGKAAGIATASGDLIWVKSGTYTLTSSTANVAGGKVELSDGVKMEGYGSATGDMGTPPVINAGAITGITIIKLAGGFNGRRSACINITADGNSGASNNGFDFSVDYQRYLFRCVAIGCPGTGFVGGGTYSRAALCLAKGCGGGFSGGVYYGCGAVSCTGNGFDTPYPVARCIAAGCNVGYRFILGNAGAFESIAHANASHGFSSQYDIIAIINSIATSNGGYGFYIGDGITDGTPLVAYNASRSNTSGAWAGSGTPTINTGHIALSADPYDNAAGYSSVTNIDDLFACFRPNTTSGGGAALRAAGYPSYQDIGAAQHQDSGGGSTVIVVEDD